MKPTIRRRLYSKIPQWIKNHDFELFAAFLCVVGAIPILTGQVDPKSMDAQLPNGIVFAWGLVLFTGPFLVATGIFFSYREGILLLKKIKYMRREALGLAFLGISSMLYAVMVLIVNTHQGWFAAIMTVIFSLTCLTREMGVQERIDQLKGAAGVPSTDTT